VQYVALRIGSQRLYRKRSQQHQQQHIVSHEEIREQVAAQLRYPSIAWSVFVFLLPGVLFSAMSLLAHDNKDDLFGAAPFAGRAVFGSVAMVVGLLAAAAVVHSISVTVWPVICTAPTSEVLCVPHLPRWFLTLCGPSWLLPTVMWETKYHKLRWSSLFSSVASTDALWVQPLLQVHGAVFSLVAAIPFPRSVCAVQFVAAMLLMCLPMGLVIQWRLRLLRRTPSNVLSLLSNAIAVGVILCTWIYADGPVRSQSAAAEARDGLGWALTVVSVTKTVLAVISAAAEKIATRNHKKFTSAWSQSGSGGGGGVEGSPLVELAEMWGFELVANQTSSMASLSLPHHKETRLLAAAVTSPEERRRRMILEDHVMNFPPQLQAEPQPPPRDAQRLRHVQVLDAHIELVARSERFMSLRDDAGRLQEPQWKRLQAFTLKLLITRASRAKKV
jgi:hypothetical protein